MAIYLSLFIGYHDSAVSFSDDSRILLHIEAERVFRKKHMRANIADLDTIVLLGLNYLGKRISDVDTLFLCRWGCLESRYVSICGKRFAPVWTDHHANHIALGHVLGLDNALAVCADGGSENGCSAIYYFDGKTYKLVEDLDDTLLTGRYYGTLTQLVICDDFEKAHIHWPGKTMGLSAFGRYSHHIAQTIEANTPAFRKLNTSGVKELLQTFSLSSYYSNMDWQRWHLAYSGQKLWEEAWLAKLTQHKDLSENLIFSGGCAHNVLLNESIHRSGIFSNVFVPPTCGDEGQSLGALLHQIKPVCDFPYLGRSFGETDKLPESAVEDLVAGKIVFWFNGRSEVGARALGNRSILALPDSVERRVRLSETVKKREWYRPVAPVILEDKVADWFDIEGASPFMLRAIKARHETLSRCPAIVHVDGSSRVQTVSRRQNPILHTLLECVWEVTGIPMLMNTSMNFPGEPICDSPEDAILTFYRSGADVLYLNGKRIAHEQ